MSGLVASLSMNLVGKSHLEKARQMSDVRDKEAHPAPRGSDTRRKPCFLLYFRDRVPCSLGVASNSPYK